MALSAAMQWALANGMSEADVYQNINDFLASNPTAAQTQAQMAQYGISPEDVAAATGGKSGGMLSGNIMAGASWNSTNTALQDALTQATGQQTANYAVGGSTTTDTLNQLNTFLAGGGQFDPNATVYLQAGGVDFIQGVDKGVVKDNLNQIVQTLGSQGVNVVLTGSPYATSVQDVIDNKFNPEVDPIFKEVAKANSNVALVNTQGEILQNKNLLVDALHTNAEGTAIYNQSVIDALSQFKNEVPPSTPQAIAQTQRTGAIPTARGTVIEGDNIDEQIAGVPQVVYETRVDPNNPANWETYNPKTGEIIDSGTFAGGGDRGLLAAAAPVIGLAASTVGLPFISGMLGSATGLTGSALAGATGATIGAGTQAVTGASKEDILKAALIGGGGGFLGSELNNLMYDSTSAADLAAGLDPRYGGSNPLYGTKYDAAMADLLGSDEAQKALADYINGTVPPTPVAVNTPVMDAGSINITGAAAPVVNTGGLLSSVTTPTINVTAPKTSQQVDQAVINLVNSQLAANTNTPANLANVEVTAARPATAQDVVSAVTASLPINNNNTAATVTTPATNTSIPTQTITAPKLTTVGDTLATLPATMLPSTVTNTGTTTTTTADNKKTNELGLTDEQMANLIRAGLGLFGTLGATSALTNRGTTNPVGLPTQLPPMYTDDYFTKVQQNYNQLLPAVPRDVASPLRDWYLSQYGA